MAGRTDSLSLARACHLLAPEEDGAALPPVHLALLDAAAARRPAADATEGLLREDVLRARLSVWLGLVEPPAATRALREQATRLAAGSIARITDLFVQHGQLTLPQVARVEQCLSALPGTCRACGRPFERFLAVVLPAFACPTCRSLVPNPLSVSASTPSPASGAPRTPINEEDRTEMYARTVLPLPGRPFGRYDIVCELGRGGMGVVYKAVQHGIDRVVALKTLIAGPSAPEPVVKRFLREAASCAHLTHPNIVTIHDVGTEQGVHYFTMQYIEGRTLSQHLKEKKRLPVEEACRILIDVARAVHYAHGKGVIHRDLKPSNILLDEAGHPHVMDFGLAKQVEGTADLTVSGATIGTPAYMSPEQAGGTRQEVDARSDIYSLGAVLFECIAGEKVFKAENDVQMIFKVVSEPPRRLGEVFPDAPREVEAVVAKALAKDREGRPATAWAFAQALEPFRPRTRIEAPAGTAVPAQPPRTRRMLAWWVAALMLLAVAISLPHFFRSKESFPLRPRDDAATRARALMDKASVRPPADALPLLDDAIAADPSLAEAWMRRGFVKQGLGRFEEALADYGAAIARNDGYLQAYLYRAQLLDKDLGRPDEAKKDFDRILQLDPGSSTGHLVTGISLYKQGKYAKALPYVQKAVELSDRDEGAFGYLIWTLMSLGRYDEAETWATKAACLFPRNEQFLNLRGLTFYHRGRLQEAQRDYEAALAINGSDADSWNNLGLIEEAEGNGEKAEADFGKAIQIQPQGTLYLKNRAELLMREERPQDGLADAEKAISIDPKDSYAHLLLGEIEMGLAKAQEALAQFNEAIKLNPRSGAAYWNRATAYAVKLDFADVTRAIDDLEKGLKVDPRDTRTRTMFEFSQWLKSWGFQLLVAPSNTGADTPRQKAVARLRTELPKLIERLSKSRVPAQAVQYMDSVIGMDTEFADGYFLKGTCWALGLEFDKALPCFEKAAQLNPHMVPAKGMIASIAVVKRDWEKAIAQYDEIVRTENTPLSYRFLRGVAELDKGDKAKAKADFEGVKAGSEAWPGIEEWIEAATE